MRIGKLSYRLLMLVPAFVARKQKKRHTRLPHRRIRRSGYTYDHGICCCAQTSSAISNGGIHRYYPNTGRVLDSTQAEIDSRYLSLIRGPRVHTQAWMYTFCTRPNNSPSRRVPIENVQCEETGKSSKTRWTSVQQTRWFNVIKHVRVRIITRTTYDIYY